MAKTKMDEARRKKIKALIRDARTNANYYGGAAIARYFDKPLARLLDDLADVAEEYLKGKKH